jgi:hypothetical protein
MTRSWLAAVLVLPMAQGVVHPAVTSAQDLPTLAGRWTLNRELSQFPREVGFSADWMAASTSGADSTATRGGRSQGGAPSAGGGISFPVSRVSREDSMRNALLTDEVRNPPAHLIITESATEVAIAPDKGSARVFHPGGKEEVLQLDGVAVTATATREAGRLVVRYKVDQGHELRYTYLATASPPQLVVEARFLERGKGDIVKRVYEPERQTDTPAATPAAPPVPEAARQASPPAPGDRGAAQGYDRQPEARFKGLTTLGVVVEGLGPQATTCGLRQGAIESGVVKQLTGAGLKVSLNSDEDTYLYVNVGTATVGNGLCVSRYDAYLYSHATAGLEYHPTPVLVDVSLMHKGGLAAGAPVAHAESVMRGLQDYVGQFTARIHDANK